MYWTDRHLGQWKATERFEGDEHEGRKGGSILECRYSCYILYIRDDRDSEIADIDPRHYRVASRMHGNGDDSSSGHVALADAQ